MILALRGWERERRGLLGSVEPPVDEGEAIGLVPEYSGAVYPAAEILEVLAEVPDFQPAVVSARTAWDPATAALQEG